jgi:mevalonate kinase
MSSNPAVFESAAPGKAILCGEHAVVHGSPAIAVPVFQVRAVARVRRSDDGARRFSSRNTGLDLRLEDAPDGFWGGALVAALERALAVSLPPFWLEIDSSIPVEAGLGSGAALAVASARALAAFAGRSADDETVNRIAFETEKIHHGTPSGIDNTTVTFARPVYYRRNRPVETFLPAAPLHIVIGLTGIASATGRVVADVRTARDLEPDRYTRIFAEIGAIVDQARAAIKTGDLPGLGRLMDLNHEWLCEINVSAHELDRLVAAARTAGALGAKLSGGGRGGNMIALVTPGTAAAVEKALTAAGAVGTIRTEINPP